MQSKIGRSLGSQRLAEAIRSRGLSVNRAGDRVGAAKGALSRILRGERSPELRLAVSIQREFDVPVETWLENAVETAEGVAA